MKLKIPKVPKIEVPKIGLPNIKAPKIRLPKRRKADSEFKESKPGKRKKLALLVLLLVLAAAAAVGVGMAKGIILEDLWPFITEESQKHQGQEKQETDKVDMTGLEGYLATDFIETLKSGEYLIRYSTTTVYNGESYDVETTYAVKGENIALSSNDRATVIKDKRVHMLNHANKSIISWNVTGDNHLERIETDGISYVGTTESGGLVCEEYATASTGIKLYFDGEKLMRIDTAINGLDVVMDVIEVSKAAPESLFEVPADYMSTSID